MRPRGGGENRFAGGEGREAGEEHGEGEAQHQIFNRFTKDFTIFLKPMGNIVFVFFFDTMRVQEDIEVFFMKDGKFPEVRPVSDLRTDLEDILETISLGKRPVVLTRNDYARYILLKIEDFYALEEKMDLYAALGRAEQDIKDGNFEEYSVFADRLEAELEQEKVKKKLLTAMAKAEGDVRKGELDKAEERLQKIRQQFDEMKRLDAICKPKDSGEEPTKGKGQNDETKDEDRD